VESLIGALERERAALASGEAGPIESAAREKLVLAEALAGSRPTGAERSALATSLATARRLNEENGLRIHAAARHVAARLAALAAPRADPADSLYGADGRSSQSGMRATRARVQAG
jgi:hypothetical protein